MNYLKQGALRLVLGTIGILVSIPAWAGIAVSPLKQEVTVNRGRTETFYISVANNIREGKGETVAVQIEAVDFSVSREGGLSFHEPGTAEYSASKWIKVSETSLLLKPAESKKIACEISAPWTASGEYYSAIMATLGPRQAAQKGLTIQCRIASGVFVTVPGRLYPKKARVVECGAAAPSAGAEKPELTITATISNEGRVLFDAEGEVKIRDKAGRLWAKVPLMSRRSRVLPGDLRDFSGCFSEPLPPGEYVAEVVFDYGSEWKKARAEVPFSLSPAQAAVWQKKARPDRNAALVIEPAQIEQAVAAGGFRGFTLRVSNAKPFPISIRAQVVESEAERSGLGKWIQVSPASFNLAGSQNRSVIFTLQAPKHEKGEHKGEIRFTVKSVNGEDLGEEPVTVPLSVNIR